VTKVIREKIVSMRLTQNQWQAVVDEAEREFLTPSELMRVSIAEYLARRGVDILAYRGVTRGPWAASYNQGHPEHVDKPAA
jgi:hypothetical protein